MDGIFGVGLAEMLIIGLVLFVIGGPENTAKWARELGRWVRKGREMWADVMAQLETELGDEGKEIVDAAREVGQEVRGLRSMTSPRSVMQSAIGSELKAAKSDLKNAVSPLTTPAAAASAAGQPADEGASAGASASDADPADAETVAPEKSADSGSDYTAWAPPTD